MRADPPRRKNNRCANPGCDRPLVTITAQHHLYKSAVDIAADPFCSTECCKAFHGVESTLTRG